MKRIILIVLSAAALALGIALARTPDSTAAAHPPAAAPADREAAASASAVPASPVESTAEEAVQCRAQVIRGARYRVCEVAAADVPRLRLMARDRRGAPLRTIARADSILRGRGERLLFATNAGLYHRPDSATGMLVADSGHTYSRLNESAGPPDPCASANFYCPPNGVFFVAGGRAAVRTTAEFARRPASAARVQLATQSGPMLVHRGALARRWNPGSPGKVRNGVGVRADGTVVFAIADDAGVGFHQFATAFRDELDCENALFLDGTISQLYAGPGSRMPPTVREFAGIFVVAESASTGR